MNLEDMMDQAVELTEKWMLYGHPHSTTGDGGGDDNTPVPILYCRPKIRDDMEYGSHFIIPEIQFYDDNNIVIFRGTPTKYVASGRNMPRAIITDPIMSRVISMSLDAMNQWLADGCPEQKTYGDFTVITGEDSNTNNGLYVITTALGDSTILMWEPSEYRIELVGVFSSKPGLLVPYVKPRTAEMPFIPDHAVLTDGESKWSNGSQESLLA